MKVKFKLGGSKYEVEFSLAPTPDGFSLLAKDTKNLDILQNAIADSEAPAYLINTVLQKELEKQLKLPIDIDSRYPGAGYGFKFDIYSIAKMLK